MKLMDKIKNLFLDEEEYEVEDEEEFPKYEENKTISKEKKEVKESSKDELPKVMQETIKQEEKVELKVKPEDFINNSKVVNEPKEPVKKFNFPIDFSDEFPSRNSKPVLNDIVNEEKVSRSNNVNVLNIDKKVTQKVTEMYSHREEEKVKPKFKASPVISPVYGVLDKNYTKEEVKERTEEKALMKRPSKKVDFETVRKKAFGNLTDEIKDNMLCENCELYKEVKRISSLKEDDLLYDMTIDDPKEVTIEKAYDDYEEFGVVYEPKVDKMEDKLDSLDGLDNEILDSSKIDEEDDFSLNDEINKTEDFVHSGDDIVDNIENELPSREEKKKETKVDEDFFELIDSMYKERVDE